MLFVYIDQTTVVAKLIDSLKLRHTQLYRLNPLSSLYGRVLDIAAGPPPIYLKPAMSDAQWAAGVELAKALDG